MNRIVTEEPTEPGIYWGFNTCLEHWEPIRLRQYGWEPHEREWLCIGYDLNVSPESYSYFQRIEEPLDPRENHD